MAFDPATGMPAGFHPSKCKPGAFQPGLAPHARQERWPGPLLRLGLHDRRPDREERALVGHRVVTPAGQQRRHEVVHALAPGGDVGAACDVLLGRPPDTEPDGQPATRQEVDRRQPPRQLPRPVVAGDEDRRPEPRRRRPRRHGRQQLGRCQDALVLGRHHGSGTAGVPADRLERPEEVVLHPQARVAVLLGPHAELAQHVDRQPGPELGHAQSDPRHGRAAQPMALDSARRNAGSA